MFARAHSLPKIHKHFFHLPNLRPNIDTTHYHVSQYLSEIFQPFTINDYDIKDSFYPGNRIENNQQELLDKGYRFVSLSPYSQMLPYRDT